MKTCKGLIFVLLVSLLAAGCTLFGAGMDSSPTGAALIATRTLAPVSVHTASPTPSATPLPSHTATPTTANTVAAAPVSPAPTANPTPTPVPTKQDTTNPAGSAPTPAPTPEPDQGQTGANPPSTTGSTQTGPSQASGSDCIDKAAFYDDVTVPDDTVFRQGVPFVKTWRIRNVGTCSWGSNYSLIFAGGDILNGSPSSPLPKAEPGDIINISVDLTSPANGGTYVSNWEFQGPDGKRFGVNAGGIQFIWTKIVVSYIVVGPTATPNPQAAGGCAAQANVDYANQVLTLINQARASQGLKVLTLKPQLSGAAQAHSQDMACSDFVDHTGSDGSTWYTRIAAQGYSWAYASENIYVGKPEFGGTPDGAFTWWMNSQVHRSNILSPKVTEIGFGYAFTTSSTYGGYYTVDFARPKGG